MMTLRFSTPPVAIITSVYDAYDPLPDICAQTVPVDWVAVTDDPHLDAPGWRVEHRPIDMPPRLAAKHPKIYALDYTTSPVVIWCDAAFWITSPSFAADMLGVAAQHAWAMFAHPGWDCIYTEAQMLAGLGRHVGDLAAQIAHYQTVGHPTHGGLWASGVIVRRRTARNEALAAMWAAEMTRWDDHHDQLSFAHIAWTYGLTVHRLPGTHTENRWLDHRPSERHFACD